MTFNSIARNLWLPFVMLALSLTAVIFRPLFPIDETRYLTVAWEMLLRGDWLEPLTVNFAPYHHKPPILFWLINLSWSIFGISRGTALIPITLSSLLCVYLTGYLGRRFFPEEYNHHRTWLVMVGSLAFMFYGTLIMFDFTLCAFVLLSLIALDVFKKERRLRYMVLLGFWLGLGVLTKGPVAYLYVLPVALFGPLWIKDFSKPGQWYSAILVAVFISFIPVLFWLVPVIMASDSDFALWLIWKQTAGRITGNFNASHARPLWFYLPLIPIIFMPWLFFPSFWRGLSGLKSQLKTHEGLRFLLFWLVPIFISFSFISGKQPHYLVPLMPGIALFVAYRLQSLEIKTLAKAFAVVCTLFIGGQAIASETIFKKYTLEPISEIIKTQPKRPLMFVRNYHGELGFMARRKAPVDDRQMDEIDQWFDEHPDGWAVIRFKDDQPQIQKYKMIFSHLYRGKNLGVFEK